MPIEVRELVIKVTVSQPEPTKTPAQSPSRTSQGDENKDSLVAHCVEQVMDIIHNMKER